MRNRDLETLIDASLGARPLDLVVRGGRVLDVYRGEWLEADVGVAGGRIVRLGRVEEPGGEELDASGRFVVPGFFDPHFHAGGCHLSPTRLADALLARGTTSTVCDFQEHYVVAGLEAARFALDEARAAGLRVFYLVPIHMFVVDALGASGEGMRVDDLLEMLSWPETVAINEPPPGPVLGKHPEALRVIDEALARGKIYSGHAPEVGRRVLEAYAATGASSDHESTRAADAWEKLSLGLKVIMREGSAAPDLARLVELAREHPRAARHMMLGTDEVDPVDLDERGHMDHKIRVALAHGVELVTAYQMATLNPAEYYRVDHEIGSLAPGRHADLVVLSDPETVEIETVVAGGRVVDPAAPAEAPEYPARVLSEIRVERTFGAADFAVPAEGAGGDRAAVRVVGVVDGSLVSESRVAEVEVRDGQALADPERDLLKMTVVDRYRPAGEAATAFVSGFGFRGGAAATTYAHPFYNLLVVGADDESMALAANRLRELGGGMAVVRDGAVVAEWALPIVGIFSTEPLAEARAKFVEMNEALRGLGCSFKAPVLALSFAALVTIPALGLTSRGLYDVEAGAFVPPVVEGSR